MGVYVFNNQIFDSWLTKKSDEIMSKVDRETISNEDMLILILKAQTNHFHHMDDEFREEFKSIKNEMREMKSEFTSEFKAVRSEFRGECGSLRSDFKDLKTEVNAKFDRIERILMWMAGLTVTLFSGLYFKLFLG